MEKSHGLKVLRAITILIMSLFIFTSVSFSNEPEILSFTVQPPTPGFGDLITVTVEYCSQLYNDDEMAIVVSTQPDLIDARISGAGQVFIVSRAGINVHTSVPAASPGAEIGYTSGGTETAPGNCYDCGGTEGKRHTVIFGDDEELRMPNADYFPGCNPTALYLHVGMKDNNLNDGDFHTRDACSEGHIAWSIPVLPAELSIHKYAEGVVQDPGDLLLFSIDYEYANGHPTISDNIPIIPGATFELVSFGPQSIVGGTTPSPALIGPISAGTNLSWTLPDRTGQRGKATGTVWFLLRVVGTPTPGGIISNTANGSMGAINDSSTANVTVGKVVVTLTKSQNADTITYGDQVTYYLEYQINGSKLIDYQPFDNIPLGAYTNPTPPTGWRYVPEGGAYGTWYVEDACNTGDRVLRGVSGTDEYPGLLIDNDISGTGCTVGTIIATDVLINPAGGVGGNGYEGADGLVVIRNDGVSPNGNAFALVLSIDDFIGDNSTGNVGFQVCNPNCDWPLSVDTVSITGNKWYRVKIETIGEYEYRAKVWPKGDPEPGAWTISYNFANIPANIANMACSASPWYAGVGQQGGANGTTQDSYNNFVIYEPRESGNTHVIDTVPAGIGYVGSNPASTGGTTRDWNLGLITNEGGTLTWWGTVDTCDPVTNRGTIYGTGIAAVDSNETVLTPICPTPVITLDKSHTPPWPTAVGIGDTVSWSLEVCNSAAGPPANPMIVWDTIPAYFNWGGWVGTPGSGATAPGGLIYWDVSTLGAGSCTTVGWWGTLNGLPANPLTPEEYYFAYLIKTKTMIDRYAMLQTVDGDDR